MKPVDIVIPTIEQAAHILSQFEIQPNGCSFWTGGLQGSGYGVVGYGGHTYLVHRVIWTIVNGSIPEDLIILHDCEKNYPVNDVSFKRCGRIDHLVLGTCLDNAHDRIANGRERKGDQRGGRNPRAYLKTMDILTIHKLRRDGLTLEAIGNRVGTSMKNVSLILHWENWKHLRLEVEATLNGG